MRSKPSSFITNTSAHAVLQAVDDCTTVAAIFKLLEGFEGLLEREAIARELERKYLELLVAFSVDLRQVRRYVPDGEMSSQGGILMCRSHHDTKLATQMLHTACRLAGYFVHGNFLSRKLYASVLGNACCTACVLLLVVACFCTQQTLRWSQDPELVWCVHADAIS